LLTWLVLRQDLAKTMDEEMELAAANAWQKQPERETVVWQHNSLAEARYELTAREQKLLLYVIAMIEPEDEDFKRYVVNIPEFAQLADLQKDDLYRELRDLAKSLKQKPLIVPHHFDEHTGTFVDLVTSWFDTAYVGRNGAGYFAVTLSPVLKPYLLQVKREFFRFRLYQVMQLRSSYAIRLYQWAKRWEFRKSIEITVQDFRNVLGASNLAEYADFKRRAIKPAIDEINRESDLSISFRELKRERSKAVDRLVFSIKREKRPELEVLQPPAPPQLEFGLETQSEDDQLKGLRELADLNRYRKNPIPAIGNVRPEKSQISDTEIPNREKRREKNDDDDQLRLHAQLSSKQPVVVVASSWPGDDDEPTEIVEKLTEKLKLSYDQSKTVQFYLDQDGKGYVLEKLRITRSKDLRNAGGFFIRALEKDYREPVTNTKPPPPPKKKRVEPKPEEPPATDEERVQTGVKLREFIETLRTSR
jgi:hypothetical protein